MLNSTFLPSNWQFKKSILSVINDQFSGPRLQKRTIDLTFEINRICKHVPNFKIYKITHEADKKKSPGIQLFLRTISSRLTFFLTIQLVMRMLKGGKLYRSGKSACSKPADFFWPIRHSCYKTRWMNIYLSLLEIRAESFSWWFIFKKLVKDKWL